MTAGSYEGEDSAVTPSGHLARQGHQGHLRFLARRARCVPDGALEGPAERSCFNSPMLAPELSS
jgi:hypothetical protein